MPDTRPAKQRVGYLRIAMRRPVLRWRPINLPSKDGLIGRWTPALLQPPPHWRQPEADMLILNFTHHLTADHLARIQALAGRIDAVVEIPTRFDCEQDFAHQAAALADACNLTPAEWQTLPILIVPPAFSFIAATLLAELHDRMGYFPSCVRLRPVAGRVPPRYEVAEILPLNGVRGNARRYR